MNRYKMFGFFLVLVGMLSLPFRLFALEVSIESREVRPGEAVPLQVRVDGAAEVGNIAFDLEYDGMQLELVDVVPGKLLERDLFATNPEAFPSRSGLFRFNGVLAKGFTGSGDLLRLTFSIADTVHGSLPITFKELTAANIYLEDVALARQDGGFVVQTGVSDSENVPWRFHLDNNFPNPFNAATVIRYTLPEPSEVLLTIYDVLGRRVRTLTEGRQQPGRYQVRWDGRDAWEKSVGSGVYLYKLRAGDHVKVKRMVLLR